MFILNKMREGNEILLSLEAFSNDIKSTTDKMS